MAIVYPLASPAQFGFVTVRWGPATNTARARAPWTFQDAVQVFDGAMWVGELSVLPQDARDGRRLAAWLTSLEGGRGTFLLGDPGAKTPFGAAVTAPGAPVVDGAAQTGAALNIRGLPVSTAGWLLAGDNFSLGAAATARLYMALEDVDSDALGKATITTWPRLRSSPVDGATVTVDDPQGLFATPSKIGQWTERLALIYDGVTIPVAEVVRP